MGNYELLTPVHPSCKKALRRETHFRGDASRPGSCGLGEGGARREGHLPPLPQQPGTPGPQPRCARVGGWVGGLLFYFISLEGVANLPNYLHLSGAPGRAIEL